MKAKFKILLASSFFLLEACTGVTSINSDLITESAVSACGETSFSSYTLRWTKNESSDLSGYKIYFQAAGELSKHSNTGIISVDASSTSKNFTPSDFNISTCAVLTVAITATGYTLAESSLSQSIVLTID